MSQTSTTTNPYCARLPVTDPGFFVGRDALLSACREIVAKKGCLSLVGEPRIGLTSILNHLMRPESQARCRELAGELEFVYLDCTSFPEPGSLVRYLLQTLDPDRAIPNTRAWQPIFGRLIAALEDLRPRRAVLLMDDFEHVGSSEHFTEFTLRLRALAVHVDMTLITTTHIPLVECCNSTIAESPFPNMFQVRHVGALDETEAREFLAKTSAVSGVDLTPHADEILALGGRLPYFLQMACCHYYEALRNGTHCDRTAVAECFLTDVTPDMDDMWQRLPQEQREALCRVVEGKPIGEIKTDLMIRGYLDDKGVFSSAFRQYIESLTIDAE